MISIFENFVQNIESVETFFKKLAMKALEEDKSSLENRTKYYEDSIKEIFGEEVLKKFLKLLDDNINDQNAERELFTSISKEKYAYLLLKIDEAPKLRDKNFEILASGAFITLNNYFEFLFADLLTYYFINNKNQIEEKNISISLSELKNYSTIDEAYNEILFKEVEKLLIDLNFEEIKKYFQSLKVGLSEEFVDWNYINEIRERRHILVHNNSIVNKKYITKSGNPFNLAIGDTAKIKVKYFQKAIDEIRIAGILLIMNSWGKWEKNTTTEAIVELLTTSFELLKQKKYLITTKVCEYVETHIKPLNDNEDNCVLRSKFNHCIALKRLGEKEACQKKLNEIRISTLSPIFRIVNHILKDEFNEGILLFKQAIIVDEFSIADYLEWPIFDELRENEELNSLATSEFNEKTD